jgi:hypothetical protein
MARPNSDRLLLVVGTLVGGVIGAIMAIGPEWDPASDLVPKPVEYSVMYYSPPQPGVDAVLKVEFFGRWTYTRTAPNPGAFATETAILDYAPPIAMIGLGMVTGAAAAILVARRRRKRS